MDTMKGVLDFFASYHLGARVVMGLCLFGFAATLAFGPRAATGSGPASKQRTYLKISPVVLTPYEEGTLIQITAFVDEVPYQHPSMNGVEWLEVGPSMTSKIIELPERDVHRIYFTMRSRKGDRGSLKESSSQEIVVKPVPYSGQYNLHAVSNRTRSGSVTASIPFQLYRE